MRIQRANDAAAVHAAAELFDAPPTEEATARFLGSPDHHLLLAYDDAGAPVGMVTGVETTHPDKGTEMFLYELGVAPDARRRGIGTALVQALAALARERGCYDMWVGVDVGDEPALATYRRAGPDEESACVVLTWELRGGA
jgi:ribosomal protein S18 acetylase RimI-like enzyme